MSLVGSLEDLGLADILQIVSLSRKSGVLKLRSESGDGRIMLHDGLVQGAAIKGEAADLRALLVSRGFVEPAAFDRARDIAGAASLDLDAVLGRECGLRPERLAWLRRERVERLVVRMFGWRSGEFSFEIRDEVAADDRELLLPSGLNTQYLAMEATRLGDETMRNRPGAPSAAERDGGDVEAPVFSGEESAAPEPAAPESEPQAVLRAQRAQVARSEPQASEDQQEGERRSVGWAADGVEVLALASAQRAEEEDSPAGPDDAEVAPRIATHAPAEVAVHGPASGETRVRVPVLRKATPVATGASHLVAIDPDLSSLEWLKASVNGLFHRVHIFQRRDTALDRIRQYLARGIVPIVVLSDVGRDRHAAGAAPFVRRLRALAPAMPILALRPEHATGERSTGVDGVVLRPNSPSADPDRWHLYQSLALRLRSALRSWVGGDPGTTSARRRASGVLGRLKGVSERLRDPATQGEVLSLVLEFAAETFERVAMFMVRDDVAVGMAQHGLPPTGGPDDAGMRTIELDAGAMPELFEAVMAERTPQRRALSGPRERKLASRLGSVAPREAYTAPIESGGCVVALVYADNLPDEKPLPDTTAFEIVLHEAGLVLDRAVLERTLAERG